MKNIRFFFALALCTASILLPHVYAQGVNNFSTRMDMLPGGNYIMGFSVEVKTTLLLRAVGPSLAQFGVTNPVTQPTMDVFDAQGRHYGFAYYSPTINATPPNDPITIIDAAVGAFALTGGEQLSVAVNFADVNPGSYTVNICNRTGVAGTILFEVYVVPPGTYALPGFLLPVPPAPPQLPAGATVFN